jgi:predicted ABC-type ATPase
MSGQAGAGKTYSLSKIQDGKIGTRIVNTDKLVEYYNFTKNVAADLDRVKLLTKEQLSLYINSMLPLFVDSTSTNPNALVRRKGILSSLGYDCGMVFVNTDLETSIKRVQNRNRKVPEDLIREKYKEIQELVPFYKTQFNFYIEIDNNDGELNDNAVLKAHQAVNHFYTAPIDNPLGKMVIDKMKKNNWKYFNNGIYELDYIKRLVDVWYKH